MELYLNKPFSVENNKNAFNMPNPAYIKGAQHLKKKKKKICTLKLRLNKIINFHCFIKDKKKRDI